MNLSKSDLDKLLKNSEENIIESNKVIALNELIIKTVKRELIKCKFTQGINSAK